jgi:hypothetical protein
MISKPGSVSAMAGTSSASSRGSCW